MSMITIVAVFALLAHANDLPPKMFGQVSCTDRFFALQRSGAIHNTFIIHLPDSNAMIMQNPPLAPTRLTKTKSGKTNTGSANKSGPLSTQLPQIGRLFHELIG